MKLPVRISALFFIGIFIAGSTALGYYYYFVYSPPLTVAAQFMDAMEKGNKEMLKSEIVVSNELENGRDDGKLRPPTDAEIQSLLSEQFQRGRILDQRKREGKSRDFYYLVYREPDGRVFALIVTEVDGHYRIVIPEIPMSRRHRYLWEYTWTN